MKYFFFLSLPILALHGCGASHETAAPKTPYVESNHPAEPSMLATDKKASSKLKAGIFDFHYRGVDLTARVDEKSNVTILDWPKEWHIKGKLVRYVGTYSKTPFDKEHCERIRTLAQSGYGKDIVTTAYFSDLIFDIPPFFSVDFTNTVADALEAWGHPFSTMTITNPIINTSGDFNVEYSKNAISNILDLTWIYWDTYNLHYRGYLKKPLEQHISIRAGDYICDLVSGDAKMTITYEIQGEDKTFKVIYDPVEVALRPNAHEAAGTVNRH